MSTNLHLYHRVCDELGKWLESERITRLRNMSLLIMGLLLGQSVHMSAIVRKWPSASRDVSLVNRLRRFLNNDKIDVRKWYHPFAQQLIAACGDEPLRLIIDTTKVGPAARMMSISLAYRRRALPLVWSVHAGAKGHTSLKQQMALFDYLRPMISSTAEVWVTGDTEFQSVLLLKQLQGYGWHFVIRQRGAILVRNAQFNWKRIDDFDLQLGQSREIGWVRVTQKHDLGWFWLVLHWEDGEDVPWYLLSDRPLPLYQLLKHYRIRMWTEEMYGDMKGHGFDLEATHLRDTQRISRLLLGVCLTFVWLISLGSWVVKRGFRPQVDRKSRRDKSYFRIGWDWVERCLRLDNPLHFRFVPYF